MIRQFTIVPALLAGAAMIISACSADMPDLGDLAGGSGGSGSGSSNSSSQSATEGIGSIAGSIKRVLEFTICDTCDDENYGEPYRAGFLLEDGSLVERMTYTVEHFRPVDLKDIKHIPYYRPSAGFADYNLCALTHSSDVYCWGENEYGQVGNGTYDSTFKEKTKVCINKECNVFTEVERYNSVKVLSDVQSLSRIDVNAYCALTNSNDTYCWGENTRNALFMDESFKMTNTPTKIDNNMFQVASFVSETENVTSIDKGNERSCEIHSSGTVTCQGYNSAKGMLLGEDNKALLYSANPIEITGVEQAELFIPTYFGGFYLNDGVCVLRKDDKIQCWGDDLDGVVTYTP